MSINRSSKSYQESNGETRRLIEGDADAVPELTQTYKINRIITLFFLWVCFGAFSEITGPVIPELIAQTDASYETLAQSISLRGAGHALGGIIGGLTVDRLFHHVDIFVSVGLIAYTVIGVAAAYMRTVTGLFLIFFVQGSTETMLILAGYRIALKTWKEKAAGPLHALHMGYGIGSIVVPQLAAPFLDPRFSGGAVQTGYNNTCPKNDSESGSSLTINLLSANSTTTVQPTPKYPAEFVKAYWILAGVSLSMSCVFLAYYIHGRVTGIRIDDHAQRKQNANEKPGIREAISFRSCSPLQPRYSAMLIACLFFHYLISVPMIRAFSKFIFSYARDGPCLSVEESTSLESAYFAAVTIGRLVTFLSSYVLHMKIIVQIEVIGVLICNIVLYFFHDNITMLWVFCTALGFFTGPIIPSAYAWANRYIEVTSTAQIIPQIGAALGDVAFLMLAGYSYQNYGPYTLWTYELIMCGGICVVVWVMQVIGSLHGDRYKAQAPEAETTDDA